MFDFLKKMLYIASNAKTSDNIGGELSKRKVKNPTASASDKKPADNYERKVKGQALGEVSLISKVIQDWTGLSRAELSDWRWAIEEAKSVTRPRRLSLMELYERCLYDAHLASVLETRKLRVKSSNFKIVSKATGKDEPKLMELFEQEWFIKFLDLCSETRFFGHSLIEFGDTILTGSVPTITYVALVPRSHIIPELGVLLPRSYDSVGIDFRHSDYEDACIEIGDPFDLGLLAKAAPKAIMKKCMEIAWLEDGEMFGTPMRIVKTVTRDPKELAEIDRMMEEMGSAAWGRFPEGTSIDFKESGRSDAYKIYQEFINLMNSEMSKIVLGQTMQTDGGQSEAQARVHDELSDDYLKADKSFIASVINQKLIPMLIRRGFPLTGFIFVWDEPSELSIKEQWEIDKGLIELGYKIPVEYLSKNYSVPIDGRELPQPQQAKPVANFPNPLASRAAREDLQTMPSTNSTSWNVVAPVAVNKEADAALLSKFEDMAKKVYEGKLTDKQAFQLFTKNLGGIFTGVVDENIRYNDKRKSTAYFLKMNAFIFSGAKTLVEADRLKELMQDGKGGFKSFNDFKNEAKAIHTKYNIQYLNAEYNYVIAAAQMADKWLDIVENAEDFPLLKYDAIQDERTRSEHAAMDSIIRPVTDPFWKSYFPPNGWNCRCDVIQLEKGEITEAPEQPINELFKNNVGAKGVIFSDLHPYFEAVPKARWEKAIPTLLQLFNEDKYERYKENDKGNFIDIHPMADQKHLEQDKKVAEILMDKGYNVRLRYYLGDNSAFDGMPNPDAEIMLGDKWVTVDFKEFKNPASYNASFEKSIRKAIKQAGSVVFLLNVNTNSEDKLYPEEIKGRLESLFRNNGSLNAVVLINPKDNSTSLHTRTKMALENVPNLYK